MHVCTYTHAAARLVGGVAIAHLLQLDARLHDSWTIVDEMSLIPVDTFVLLVRVQTVGPRSFSSVIQMVSLNPWQIDGAQAITTWLPKVFCSAMCSHIHIRLTEYKRRGDMRLLNVYTSFHKTTVPLHVSINKA